MADAIETVAVLLESARTNYESCNNAILGGNSTLLEFMPQLRHMCIKYEAELIELVTIGWSRLE